MPESVILDTSVLIALSKINNISLLCKLYHKVLLPTGVIKEFGDIKLECRKNLGLLEKLKNITTGHHFFN